MLISKKLTSTEDALNLGLFLTQAIVRLQNTSCGQSLQFFYGAGIFGDNLHHIEKSS